MLAGAAGLVQLGSHVGSAYHQPPGVVAEVNDPSLVGSVAGFGCRQFLEVVAKVRNPHLVELGAGSPCAPPSELRAIRFPLVDLGLEIQDWASGKASRLNGLWPAVF